MFKLEPKGCEQEEKRWKKGKRFMNLGKYDMKIVEEAKGRSR